MAQATSLQPGQIRHLLHITAATSRQPERDIHVLLLGLTADNASLGPSTTVPN